MGEENQICMKEEGGEIAPFDPSKKKKKKVVRQETVDKLAENTDSLSGICEDENSEGTVLRYEYEEILGRVYNILRENNPELGGYRRRIKMTSPQVLRQGIKKTVFVNFMDLCTYMHRQADHVMAFLLAELGTDGSLDGQQRLVVKRRCDEKDFARLLHRYMNEYVMCLGCKSPDTILSRENRLFFLRCENCGSGRSVAPIKRGFVARVGRRNAGT